MALIEAIITRSANVITVDGSTTVSGTTWHLDTDRLVQGWFGLPDTDTVIERRTGTSGWVIAENRDLGKEIDLRMWAVSSSMANAYLAMDKAHTTFAMTNGNTGTLRVDFGAESDTLTVQRRGPLRLTPVINWNDASPDQVVWQVDVTLISEATQFS